MTKRVNMAPQDYYYPRTNQSQALGILPLLVIGAAVAAVWSGIDPETARAAAIDLTRTVSASLDGFFFSVHACSGYTYTRLLRCGGRNGNSTPFTRLL